MKNNFKKNQAKLSKVERREEFSSEREKEREKRKPCEIHIINLKNQTSLSRQKISNSELEFIEFERSGLPSVYICSFLWGEFFFIQCGHYLSFKQPPTLLSYEMKKRKKW